MGIMRDGRPTWPRWWPAGLAWTLWALGMLGLAAVTWLDRLLRQAGRPDPVLWTAGSAGEALVSGATVGAVLASRCPRTPSYVVGRTA
jgi:hypothetical protein